MHTYGYIHDMYTYGQDNVYVEFGKARKITTVSKTGVVLY